MRYKTENLERSDFRDLARALETGNDFPEWLIEWAYSFYADSMGYGTVTGDTQTVDEYLSERIDEVVDHFEDELKAAGWSGEING
jgi:hypothetical protein